MSLKAFHVFFVLVCTIFWFGFGVWAFRQYSASGQWGDLLMTIGSFLAGIVLVAYSRWFLRKLRFVSFI